MGSGSLCSWEQWCLFSCHQYARAFAFRQLDNTHWALFSVLTHPRDAVAPFSARSDEIREVFETKQALLAAAQEFFDRSNQCPQNILSVIGSKAKNVS